MKKMLSILMVMLTLACPALAAELSLDPIAAPTLQPTGTSFACELFSLTLPFGFTPLSQDALAGYEAAVESDYPGAAQTLLLASGLSGASIYIGATPSAQDPVEAAREAALGILGSAETASERICGANRYGSFACTAENLTYEVFFLACGDMLLTIVACNMPATETEALLESLMPAGDIILP